VTRTGRNLRKLSEPLNAQGCYCRLFPSKPGTAHEVFDGSVPFELWAKQRLGHVVTVSWAHERRDRIYRHTGVLVGTDPAGFTIDTTDRTYTTDQAVCCAGPPVPVGTFRGLLRTGAPGTYLHPATGASIRRFTSFAKDMAGAIEWRIHWQPDPGFYDVTSSLSRAVELCDQVASEGLGPRWVSLPVTLGAADALGGLLDDAGLVVLGSRWSNTLAVRHSEVTTALAVISAVPDTHPDLGVVAAAYRLDPGEPQGRWRARGDGAKADACLLAGRVADALHSRPKRLEELGLDPTRHRLPSHRHAPLAVTAPLGAWQVLPTLVDDADETTTPQLFALARAAASGELSDSEAISRMRSLIDGGP
jgi:hypothetical protein